ncbi:MAG: hypothetical protein MI810_12225 [Flavobacteriales bacterium]|nr:hypothetical protein [Flavobacteriales bacterium]
MKLFLISLCSTLLFFSCESKEETNEGGAIIETSFEADSTENTEEITQNENQNATLEVVPGGDHREYHPNGELKIEGQYDDNGLRTGLWISYYDTGIKWSESYYVAGKKDGHNLSFFPNGKVRYLGEYNDDQKIGEWKFYDEEGNLTQTENF